ncbi:MAG: type II toxin-antitoxin system VapC family toxin [Microbacterium sp.]
MTLVVDASALAEFLLQTPLGRTVQRTLEKHSASLHIPHLADTEVASVYRNLVRGDRLTPDRALVALQDLRDLPVRRWPATPLFERVWQLRHDATSYDATYVALAEALDAEFLTTDARLARGVSASARCEITVVA